MKGRVYKRGMSWYYRFDIEPDPLTGKRRQVNGSGYRTEREAWKACRDAMAEHEKGRLVSSSRHKVGEALDEWLTRIEHSIKPSMVQNWRNYAAYYVVPYIGSRDVREIDGAVCDALYAKLLAEGRIKAQADEAADCASRSHASARQGWPGNAVSAIQLRHAAVPPQARRK